MYTKEEIWNSFANEIRIIKHLSEKIPTDSHNHRPTEKQRSMLELLQYLSTMGISILDTYYTGDQNTFGKYHERSTQTTLENFKDQMDVQEQEMKELFAKFNDEVLGTELSLWGLTAKKSIHVLNLLKMMTAYKMQLFLYIKAAGNTSIGTANLWAGIDLPPMA
jgi:hypothetical protein